MTFESSGSGSIGSVGQEAPETHELKFDRNRIGGLIGLHIVNTIFMVLTLFIYRFWALTRVRRAIWPRMSLDGTPLEYTGTGLEIFLGFLKVFLLILLPYAIFSNWVQAHIINPELGFSPVFVLLSLLSSLGIFYLYAAARYLAYRYRVNRTQWRGIRGSVGGAAYVYALKSIGFYALVFVTLGVVKPWADIQLLKYKFNHTQFGGHPFSFNATTKGLWTPYLPALALYFVGIFGVLAPFAFVHGDPFWSTLTGNDVLIDTASIDPATLGKMRAITVTMAFLGMIGGGIAYLNYLIMYWRNVVGKISFGTARFSFRPTRLQVFGLFLGNWLIIILTLGILLPVAWLRKGSFLARHLTIVGGLNTDDLIQAEFDTDSRGEGLLGDFDIA